MTTDDHFPKHEIRGGGSADSEGPVGAGGNHKRLEMDPLVASAYSYLLGSPELMRALARTTLPPGLLAAEATTPKTPAADASIFIGGNVGGNNIIVGNHNVQVTNDTRHVTGSLSLARLLADALARLSPREQIDRLRRVLPTDEILERADALSLLPDTFENFERNVNRRRLELDPAAWRRKLAALERRVGLIEAGSVPCGTCFLVGPDLVLTNYHVVKPFFSGESGARHLRVRFDYQPHTDSPTYAPLERDWCLDWSPYSERDVQGTLPTHQDELDYALVRLATPAGEETETGARRGWVSLTGARAPAPEDALIILQHPRGQHLKLSFGKVLAVHDGAARLRYDTNTDSGSSGAPCLDENLELVALHHMGDPNFSASHRPAYNQGILLAAIAGRLRDKGIAVPPELSSRPER